MGVICVEMLYSMANNAGMEGIPVRKLVCDKCGKEVDTSYMDKFDIHPSSMVRIFGKNLKNGDYLDTKFNDLEYELCEDCTNQLVTFLKG